MVASDAVPLVFLAGIVVQGRRCLVLGGDREALDKAQRLHEAGAQLTVLSPEPLPELRAWCAQQGVSLEERTFEPSDCSGVFLVFSAYREQSVSEQLFALASGSPGFLLCCVDQPSHCTWTNVAQFRRGPLQIAVGSSGVAPMLASRLRAALEQQLGPELSDFAEALALLREQTPPELRRAVLAKALEGLDLRVSLTLPLSKTDTKSTSS